MVLNELQEPAVSFLKTNGHKTIVSLGCGRWINRIDNHLRLMFELNLNYYVGIDYADQIGPDTNEVFMDADAMNALLTHYYQGSPDRFWKTVHFFPGTYIEKLKDIHCAVIICQRVYPDCHWEELIESMTPKLVLQEDLHGCERQKLRGQKYVRTWSKIRQYALKPFRPWPIFPWENNLVLWQRRDFGKEDKNLGRFDWLERFFSSFIG
jgi:hypothetical protein